jgi:hypothetical protein
MPRVTRDAGNGLVRPDMRALPVHVGGRARIVPLPAPLPAGAQSYIHQWPAVYFEAAFEGDSLVLKFDDTANAYRLTIDDLTPVTLAQPGRVEIRIDALPRGPHRVRLEKTTEGVVGAFQGFYVPADAVPGRVAPRARQIEFIGDSSMTGYGNRSPGNDCTEAEVRQRTDSQMAYPALAAKYYDADYQVIAAGARGLVRNLNGFGPEIVVPRVHPYILLDKSFPYDDPAWRPQVIVVRLIADLIAPLNPGEKWASMAELQRDYVRGYGAFIADLHRRSPDAAFVIWWPDGMPYDWQWNVLQTAQGAGVVQIGFLPMRDPGFELTGCHRHYSLADHRKMAGQLEAFLDANPDFWDGK